MFTKRSQMAKDRLSICFQCTQRRGIFCGVCGCELHAKAEVEEDECPMGYWLKPGDFVQCLLPASRYFLMRGTVLSNDPKKEFGLRVDTIPYENVKASNWSIVLR